MVNRVHERYWLPLLDSFVQLEVFLMIVYCHVSQSLWVALGWQSYNHVLGLKFSLNFLSCTPDLLALRFYRCSADLSQMRLLVQHQILLVSVVQTVDLLLSDALKLQPSRPISHSHQVLP